jgi:hypothetical protein
MRHWTLSLLLAGTMGTAAAGPLDDRTDAGAYDASDFSAQVFYRVEFGGVADRAQRLGFRVDNERAAAYGAPSLFMTQLSGQGLEKLQLHGLELRNTLLARQNAEVGEEGFFASLTPVQWAGLFFSGGVLALLVASAADDNSDVAVGGSGGT